MTINLERLSARPAGRFWVDQAVKSLSYDHYRRGPKGGNFITLQVFTTSFFDPIQPTRLSAIAVRLIPGSVMEKWGSGRSSWPESTILPAEINTI